MPPNLNPADSPRTIVSAKGSGWGLHSFIQGKHLTPDQACRHVRSHGFQGAGVCEMTHLNINRDGKLITREQETFKL